MGKKGYGRPHKYRSTLKPNMGMAYKPANSMAPLKMECMYGRGCTRKDCVYSHPTGPVEKVTDGPVCLPFIAGGCAYGTGCFNRHPEGEELMKIQAKYAAIPCRNGAGCYNMESCPYAHPKALDDAPTEDNGYYEQFLREMQAKKIAKDQAITDPGPSDFDMQYNQFLAEVETEQQQMQALGDTFSSTSLEPVRNGEDMPHDPTFVGASASQGGVFGDTGQDFVDEFDLSVRATVGPAMSTTVADQSDFTHSATACDFQPSIAAVEFKPSWM